VPNDVTASVGQISAIDSFASCRAHYHTPTLKTGQATVAALAN
jgi:hypothetical protein